MFEFDWMDFVIKRNIGILIIRTFSGHHLLDNPVHIYCKTLGSLRAANSKEAV
ncbi:hypothetical protein O2N63_17100 [Aliiroseovarius sp. KMU-50]|uniref:Uncharacterized protein n=1 Tax=Aliiroseovarius salicola TaxID=3009082 RepID=A0ABT4W5P4_9RHOB|nr:hypothetical protein [Aliiroseovarius sp. KMU-50]MDA5095811.1 hypothetical protein [Aliiroseovarius sp. KMU-50]